MNSEINFGDNLNQKSLKLEKRVKDLEDELARTKRQLNETHREFQGAFEDPAIGMMRFSPEGYILKANDYVCKILGYSIDELKQKGYRDITHPDDLEESVLSEYKIINREVLFDHLEKRYIKKDGTVAWILLSYSMLFDKHQQPMYYVAHLQDITERKNTEVALQASENRFTLFMNNLPGAAFIKNHKGQYIYINQFLKQYYRKINPDGILGLTDWDIYPDDYCEQYDRNSKLAMAKGRAMTFVETTPGGDRQHYWLTCRFPILLNNKSPLMGCVRLDTSNLVHAEKKLKLKEGELKKHAENLNEVNTALKVLLDHREQEKVQLEQGMLINLEKLVFPYLKKLKKNDLDSTQNAFLDIALSNLENIISPLSSKLLTWESKLTPSELDITNLIRIGNTTDTISELLNVSTTTVAFHRRNIRLKLGLKNKKVNLMTYLRTIS